MTDLDLVARLAKEADPEFGNAEGVLSESLCGLDAIARFAALVASECAKVCEEQAAEPECPERAQYCSDAIRARFVHSPKPLT